MGENEDETHISNILNLLGARQSDESLEDAQKRISAMPKSLEGSIGNRVINRDALAAPPASPPTDSNNYIAAGAGAALGALGGYKGVRAENALRFLAPGEGVFSPKPITTSETPTVVSPPVNPVDTQLSNLQKEQTASEAALTNRLRELTGDPKASIAGFTPEQVDRLQAGTMGEHTPTLDTSGRSRNDTFNNATSYTADVTSLNRERATKLGLDPRQAVGDAGPLVSLEGSRIQVSPETAIAINQEAQNKARKEAARLVAEHKVETEKRNAIRETIENIKKEHADRELAALAEKAKADAQAAKHAGLMRGGAKVAQGALGVAGGALQGYQMLKNYLAGHNPDWTEVTSLVGSPLAAFGKTGLGSIGTVMQLPYAVKHREDIARGMTMGDVVPASAGLTQSQLAEPVPLFNMRK